MTQETKANLEMPNLIEPLEAEAYPCIVFIVDNCRRGLHRGISPTSIPGMGKPGSHAT